MSAQLPKIHRIQTLAQSRFFTIEAIDLEFSNGVTRQYERLAARNAGAIMVAAMPDANTILLVEEYAVGLERYEIGLPKGSLDQGEDPLACAQRELKEEVGFGAQKLTYLKTFATAPGYQANQIHLILAEDLYPERLVGDEPEPLRIFPIAISEIYPWVSENKLSEARSIAALFYLQHYLTART